jgi:hypothetical protein
VDHVAERTTARHLPQSAALGETVRRRRVGGAAQRTFAGLVGLELHPRRLRDAANLWAALEDAGGAALRDGRWAHPDLAPTAADLDDPIGFVDRATGRTGEDASHPQLGADLDSVLKSILDEAGASGADAAGGNPLGTAPSGTTGDAAGDTDSGGDDDPSARPGEDPGALPDDERQ